MADPLAEDGLVLLRERCEVRTTTGLSETDLIARLGDVDALIVRSETKVTARILDAAPRLAVVGRAGVGVDNIDVPAATARGVYVVNAPLGNIVAAAEHTLALALTLLRRITEADRSVRAGEWARSKFIGRELRGKTLGLVGIGRVGSEVARRATSFEMRVIAHDPFATE
ncbi:MAG: NAD(P)-dependent oxidoreductase, partial [Candidatus Limnocylindria bacterium]